MTEHAAGRRGNALHHTARKYAEKYKSLRQQKVKHVTGNERNNW